jgi:hypothetical protein
MTRVDNGMVRGMVLRRDEIEVPDDLWRKLRRLADGARLRFDRHSDRMKTDPEYREAVEHLAGLVSTRPGRLGQTFRIVAVGHMLLVKVL